MEETFVNVDPSEPFTIVLETKAPSITEIAVGALVGFAFATASAVALNGVRRLLERRNAKIDTKRMVAAGIVPEFPQETPEDETK